MTAQPSAEGRQALASDLSEYAARYRDDWVRAMPSLKWEELDLIIDTLKSFPAALPPSSCECQACVANGPHTSDCAVHGAPAFEAVQCDCGAAEDHVRLLKDEIQVLTELLDFRNALVERLKTGLEKIERGSTSVLLTAELNDEPIARGVLMCIRDDAQSALTSTSSSSSKVSEDELTASAATRGRNAAIHSSDCAIHNGPALKPGPCDCGALTSTDRDGAAR